MCAAAACTAGWGQAARIACEESPHSPVTTIPLPHTPHSHPSLHPPSPPNIPIHSRPGHPSPVPPRHPTHLPLPPSHLLQHVLHRDHHHQPHQPLRHSPLPLLRLPLLLHPQPLHPLPLLLLHPLPLLLPLPPSSSSRLRLCIDDVWLDLTHWQHQHPGGASILSHLNNQDATDAFYSLHSSDAIDRLTRLSRSSLATPTKLGDLPPVDPQTRSFRALRTRLIADGWFRRSLAWELFYLLSVYLFAALGTYFAWTAHPLLAVVCVTLSMQQAGWIGHDYVHGRGWWQRWLGRVMSGTINGFSPTWWSSKHNTHHVFTNHVGVDMDIENDPVFHLFYPTPSHDVWFRAFQHLYFVPVAAFLFISWRVQSLSHTVRTSNVQEMVLMLVNYAWLLSLGLPIAVSGVYFAGMIVAVIVTATHQSEEMLPPVHLNPAPYSFVHEQFATTRDARCGNALMEWLWGGMQYQLEHHLFPTMPKYRYAKLVKVVEEWAQGEGLDYKAESVWQIWWRNYQTMKLFAGPEQQQQMMKPHAQ